MGIQDPNRPLEPLPKLPPAVQDPPSVGPVHRVLAPDRHLQEPSIPSPRLLRVGSIFDRRIENRPFGSLRMLRRCKEAIFMVGDVEERRPESLLYLDSDPVNVSVSFMGKNHMVVEESGWRLREGEEEGNFRVLGSPPDELMLEIYRYFANRTSAGGGRRKGSGRRRRWEAERFIKIGNCCPSPARPLQGLWKGICESMNLDFYLVTYDDVGGITCRRVGDSGDPFAGYSPVFWTSNITFLNSPFSTEEQDLYSNRQHVSPSHLDIEKGPVSRILCINSSYDLVIPNLYCSFGDP